MGATDTRRDFAAPIVLPPRPIASGMSREVYALQDTNFIVKVQTKTPPRRYFQRVKILTRIRGFYKTIVPLRREMREYERVSHEGTRTARHLQHCEGVIVTDKGTGIIVKAVRRENGSLALTLQQAIESGHFNHETEKALSEFLEWFVKSDLVAADVHLKNIVVDEKNNALVLIDGIGDKTFLPVRSWFPWVNRSYKARLAKTIYSDVAISFMRTELAKKSLVLLLMFASTIFGIDIMDGHLIDG